MCGVLPPRLLQDHSPSGEPHYTALVQTPRSSGERLVNGSDPVPEKGWLTRKPVMPRLYGSKNPALGGAVEVDWEVGLALIAQPSSLAGSASPSLSSASMIITAAGLPAANLTRPSR